jgi:hypothetical protein
VFQNEICDENKQRKNITDGVKVQTKRQKGRLMLKQKRGNEQWKTEQASCLIHEVKEFPAEN